MGGIVTAVCVSTAQGTAKQAVDRARLVRGHGLHGDAHAGTWHRQVSLLANEDIAGVRARGLDVPPGAFGENIVTSDFPLGDLAVGQRFYLGSEAVLQVTQRGKECHTHCAIFQRLGDCIMPCLGVFTRVCRSGPIHPGDPIATDPDLDVLRYSVVTLSDRGATGEREDASGRIICEMIDRAFKAKLVARCLLPDEKEVLQGELIRLCEEEVCDLILTTGGTGLSPRDVTPEATLAAIDRQVPGMAEAIRAAGCAHTPRAMLSRSVCGQRGTTLIINLSGSPRAVIEQLEVLLPVLPHAVQTASGIPQDCA